MRTVFVLSVLTAGLVSGCVNVVPSSDGGATMCGQAGQACCNGVACGNGLMCSAESICQPPAVPDSGIPPTALDAGTDAGVQNSDGGCLADGDCPALQVCNKTSHQCAPGCNGSDARCAGTPTPYCNSMKNVCVACVTDAQCGEQYYCGEDGTCHSGCSADSECASMADTPHCSAAHTCVACNADTDCPLEQMCDTTSHSCVWGCVNSNHCSAGQMCTKGYCWEEAWHARTSNGAAPPDASGVVGYDPERKVVVFSDEQPRPNQTWEWDGSNWTEKLSSNPYDGIASNGNLAYDENRHALIGFGRNPGGGSITNETWLWNGSQWTTVVTANSPPGRNGGALVAIPGSGVLLTGGARPPGYGVTDTWLLSASDWTQVSSATANERYSSGAAYDAALSPPAAVLWGGVDIDSSTSLKTLEAFVNGTWITVSTSQPVEFPATGGGMDFDPLRKILLLVTETPNQTWVLDGNAWSRTSDPPYASSVPSMNVVYDAAIHRFVMPGPMTYVYGGP